MLERRVLRVRGFAEPRLAKFANTLWVGSEVGFITGGIRNDPPFRGFGQVDRSGTIQSRM